MTVDRGHDYRDFDLVAFGGAGPLHAAKVAESLGMRRTIIPPAPGLVSAFGALIADERLDKRVTLVRRLDRDTGSIASTLSVLASDLAEDLAAQVNRPADSINIHTYVSCRYVGQNYEQEIRTYWGHVDKAFELAVPINPDDNDFVDSLAAAFHEAHQRSYGYSLEDQPIESVYLGATAVIPGSPLPLQPYDGTGCRRTGRVYVEGGRWEDAVIIDRGVLMPGERVTGPAVIIEDTSTTYVPENFVADVNSDYCLVLTRSSEEPTAAPYSNTGKNTNGAQR